MQLTCPDCQAECTFDEESAATVSCPGCGVMLYSKSGNSGPLAAQLAIAGGQRVEITNEDLEKTRQWQKSIDDILPVPDQFPQRLGRYELKQKLGEGSFAEVYLAFDTGLGRDVALKIPKRNRFSSAEQLRRFLDEGRTSAILEHPGIVRVYDIGWISEEICFISMEYCPGGSLSDRLKTDTLTCDQAVELVESLADAIHFAHVAGFVHRDLKPSNVMIGRDGRPRIVDFGLALSDAEQLDHAGEVAGTLPYMSPEQIRGDAHHLDGRTDIWSLGVILYQMLVGRRPFSGSKSQIFEQIRNRDTKPLRQIKDELPGELEEICLRCLKKSPDDRYRTAKDLARALHEFRERRVSTVPKPAAAREPESAPQAQTSSKSQRLIGGLVMLALVGFIGGLYWAFGFLPKNDAGIPPLPPVVAGNHFSTSSAIFDRPYPLLDRTPVEFSWPTDALPWRHEPSKQMLVLDSKHDGYLELGSTDADHFAIEAELSKASWGSGHAGIYWGLHATETNEAKVETQWQATWFSVESDVFDQSHYFRLRLSRVNMFRRDGLIWVGTDALSQVDVPAPEGSKVRVALEISAHGPSRVIWSGQPIDKLSSGFRESWGALQPPYQSRGRFGVYNQEGSTTFRDARFMLLK